MTIFTKVPEAWREAIYYALCAVLFIAIAAGVVTTKELDGLTDTVLRVLTAVGFLMAGANTNNGS